MCSRPRSSQSVLIARNTASGITTPLGLLGEMVTRARLRGVIAAAKTSGSGMGPASTPTGTPPANCTAITWLK